VPKNLIYLKRHLFYRPLQGIERATTITGKTLGNAASTVTVKPAKSVGKTVKKLVGKVGKMIKGDD
jgi:hypothetical protein